MRAIVLRRDFLDDNYLSTELRVPVTLLRDQRLQPAGDQRDRRQHLGQLLVAVLQGAAVGRHDHGAPPVHRRAADLHDAGRRPRLHAAAVAGQPVVDGAVPAEQHASARSTRARRSRRACASFQDSIEQMLWPEKREKDPVLGDKVPGVDRPHDRRAATSRMPAGYRARTAAAAAGPLHDLLPQLFDANGGIEIGPIPKGMPVNLLANLQPLSETDDPVERLRARRAGCCELLVELKHDLRRCRRTRPTSSCAQGIRQSGRAACWS